MAERTWGGRELAHGHSVLLLPRRLARSPLTNPKSKRLLYMPFNVMTTSLIRPTAWSCGLTEGFYREAPSLFGSMELGEAR